MFEGLEAYCPKISSDSLLLELHEGKPISVAAVRIRVKLITHH
jgi:hypothetical protein